MLEPSSRPFPPPASASAEPAWVFQDDSLVAVCKPSGMLSVPGRGPDKQDCAARRVAARVPDALVVHRLDMATSGLLVFARGVSAQRRLSEAFAVREVRKGYVAVVSGQVRDAEGEIDLPLSTDWPNRPRQKVALLAGKAALTRYRVLSRDLQANTTRLALEPITGRTHQLRVHLWAIGHPIVGDGLYVPESAASARLLLHAQSIALPHPVDGETVQLESAAPF